MGGTEWFVSAVLGLVVGVGLWWLSGRCRRSVVLQKEIAAAREEVFTFLRDPDNLKLIHHLTTGIRTESKREDGHVSDIRFVWMEEVPFAVESKVRLTSDLSTFSTCMEISPSIGLYKVKLQWELYNKDEKLNATTPDSKTDTDSTDILGDGRSENITKTDASSLNEEDKNRVSCTQKDEASLMTKPPGCKSTERTDEELPGNRMEVPYANGHRDGERTLFQNTLTVTGPRIFVFIILNIIPGVQRSLMDKVKQHLEATG